LEILNCINVSINIILQKISIFNFGIKHLRISGITITEDYSIQCISVCNILSLEFNDCVLPNATNVESLSFLIQFLQALEYLSLEGTTIKTLFIKSNSLTHLNLRKTDLSDIEILDVIVQCPQLKVLDIGLNPALTEKTIIQVMERCPKLIELGIPSDMQIENESLKNNTVIKREQVYINQNLSS